MFLVAIVKSFHLFANAGFWIMMLAVAAATVLAKVVISMCSGQVICEEKATPSWIISMFGRAFYFSIMIGILLQIFQPFLMDGIVTYHYSEFIERIGPLFISSILIGVGVVILGFVPGLYEYMRISGVMVFLIGLIQYRLLINPSLAKFLKMHPDTEVLPGIFGTVGYMLIAWILVQVVQLIASILFSIFGGKKDFKKQILIPTVGILGGIITLFCYATYIRLKMTI